MYAGLADTPIEQIWKSVIDTREQLAAFNNARGVPDAFTVPPGLNRMGDGDSSGGAMAAAITADIMRLPSADRHKVKRPSMLAAVTAMQSQMGGAPAAAILAPAVPVPGGDMPAVSPAVTTPATSPIAAIATSAPAPGLVSPAPIPGSPVTVAVTTPSPVAAAVDSVTAALGGQYAPYIIGGGILLFALARSGKKRKAAA